MVAAQQLAEPDHAIENFVEGKSRFERISSRFVSMRKPHGGLARRRQAT